jgi:hypothetical protein
VDEEQLDRAWASRSIKLAAAQNEPRPGGWWTFRVVSR